MAIDIERVANVDIVIFGRDQTVLLARAPTELSVGVIRFPQGLAFPRINREEALVVLVPEGTNTRKNKLISHLAISSPMQLEDGVDLALTKIQEWHEEEGRGHGRDFKLIGHNRNENPQHRLRGIDDSVLKEGERQEYEEKMARIKESGVNFPLRDLVDILVIKNASHN